jgi:CBS domain containing-hemolysin-like protein
MATDAWLIFFMLLLSAFCSGLEIAYLSANKLKVEIDRQHGKFYTQLVDTFQRHQGQFITTILVANNIALVVYGIAMTSLLNSSVTHGLENSPHTQLVLNTLISTLVVLLVGEFIPKTLCRLLPNFFLKAFSLPAYLMYWICYPIAKFTAWLSTVLMRVFLPKSATKKEHAQNYFDMVDLQHLTTEATESVEMSDEELEHDIKIFQNALDFSEVKVRDCMVPRTEIEAIDMETSMQELTQLFIDTGYSRILVYKDSIDNIIGYVKSTDLFKSYKSIKEMLLPLDFVPETMPAQKLLTTLIKNRSSISIVVDEFGGTAGMVTLEDIMEEIFGEIEDEHDSDDLMEKKIADNEYIFSGRLEVSYVNEEYNLQIPESDEYDTIAGFVIFARESIPKSGEEFDIEGFKIRVLKTTSSKVDLIHLSISSE